MSWRVEENHPINGAVSRTECSMIGEGAFYIFVVKKEPKARVWIEQHGRGIAEFCIERKRIAPSVIGKQGMHRRNVQMRRCEVKLACKFDEPGRYRQNKSDTTSD